jgi:hypothetical protein
LTRHKIGLWPVTFLLIACATACGNESKGAPASGGMGGVIEAGGTSSASAGGVSNAGASNGGVSNGGTTNGGASNGGGGYGAGTHADPMCTTITTDPKLMGTGCNNVTDRCFFEDHASQAYSLGSKCATSDCLMYALQPETDMAKQCFLDCFKKQMMMQTGSAPSDACAACSDAVVVCGAKNCLSDCINDPMSSGCFECLCKAHDAMDTTPAGSCLVDVFAQCAGFSPPPALVGCPAM